MHQADLDAVESARRPAPRRASPLPAWADRLRTSRALRAVHTAAAPAPRSRFQVLPVRSDSVLPAHRAPLPVAHAAFPVAAAASRHVRHGLLPAAAVVRLGSGAAAPRQVAPARPDRPLRRPARLPACLPGHLQARSVARVPPPATPDWHCAPPPATPYGCAPRPLAHAPTRAGAGRDCGCHGGNGFVARYGRLRR